MIMILLDRNNKFVIAFNNKHYKKIYQIMTKNNDKLIDVFHIENVYIVKSENYTINRIKNFLLTYDS